MKIAAYFVCFFLLSSHLYAGTGALALPLGIGHSMSFDKEIKAVKSNSRILNWTITKTELVLEGKSEGMAQLEVTGVDDKIEFSGLVRVIGGNAGQTIAELWELVSEAPDVQVHIVDRIVFLDGFVSSIDLMQRIGSIASAINEHGGDKGITVLAMDELSSSGRQALSDSIEREIGSPGISVRFSKNSVFIEGTADNDFEADRAVAVVKSHIAGHVMPLAPVKPDGPAPASLVGSAPRLPDFNNGAHEFNIIDMQIVRPPEKATEEMKVSVKPRKKG